MLGTLRRALAVREIPTGREYLTAGVAGEVFKETIKTLIDRGTYSKRED